MLNKIILASKSKVRKKILDNNNIPNRVEPSNVDEDEIKNISLKFNDLVNCPLYVISTITKNGIDNLKNKIVRIGKCDES